MYLMTYGTLKKGFCNHMLLQDAKFIKEIKTKPLYRLYDCGPYPCMVKCENGVSVEGELYEVNEKIKTQLDYLEGVPYLYNREYIEVEDFQSMVIGYIYQLDVSEFKDCGASWK